MTKLLTTLLAVPLLLATVAIADDPASSKEKKEAPAVLKFKMKSLAGKEVDLAKFRGKVVLIVNVASECGYTPQYKGLQALHDKHAKDGLVVLGFPCNQFGQQEPGSSQEIAAFCKKNYGVTFDMFDKVDVNGKDACGLYKYLTSKETNPKTAGPIKWNFEKFLIARDGSIAGRFESGADPDSETLVKAIAAELAKK
jgi:glutathione peroxidase